MSSRLVGNTALRLPAEQEHVPGCPRYSLLTRSMLELGGDVLGPFTCGL